MLLGCDNPRAREHAEGALVRLSIENANRVLIIKKLVDMLQDSGTTAQEQAAAALSNLARESANNRKSIVDAQGIGPLLALLDSASNKAKENSVGAITHLCRKYDNTQVEEKLSKDNQSVIARAGGVPKLVGVLLGFSGTAMKELATVQLCTLTAEALKQMAHGNSKIQTAVAESGGIAPLVAMLGSSAHEMQANAAGALANLARNHPINQLSIAKTGAVGPLCTLVREGSAETKDESAMALWSISIDNAPNKDTIAKLGGIDPLVGLLVSGTSDKSLECVAGALSSLAHKHVDNREYISKRLVGLLSSSSIKTADRAVRVLTTCKAFTQGSYPNQMAIAKAGGIPPLITWLSNAAVTAQAQASMAVLSLITANMSTQTQCAKSDGIPPLINLVRRAGPDRRTHTAALAQEYSCRALFHLASQVDNRASIVDSQVMKPLVGMLSADGEQAPELAAVTMVRLARGNPEVAISIADKGGIVPLVKLVNSGAAGAQQQSAACLAEIALVSKNRDVIANAGGIEPLIRLMDSSTVGSPETAARVLAHLALEDDIVVDEGFLAKAMKAQAGSSEEAAGVSGSAERRAQINALGGVMRLVAMIDGSIMTKVSQSTLKHQAQLEKEKALKEDGDAAAAAAEASALATGLAPAAAAAAMDLSRAVSPAVGPSAAPGVASATGTPSRSAASTPSPDEMLLKQQQAQAAARARGLDPTRKVWCKAPDVIDVDLREAGSKVMQLSETGNKVAMQEQSAAALADLAHHNGELQDAIIDAGGVPPLLIFIRQGSQIGQEHAGRAVWHLAADVENQQTIVSCGTIPELVALMRLGSPRAQEVAAAGLSELARGGIVEMEQLEQRQEEARVAAQANKRRSALARPSSPANRSPLGGRPSLVTAGSGAASPEVGEENEIRKAAAAFMRSRHTPSPKHDGSFNAGDEGLAIERDDAAAARHRLLTAAEEADTQPAEEEEAQSENRLVSIANAGGIPPLVYLLGAGTTRARENAAGALWHLALDPSNQVYFAVDCHVIAIECHLRLPSYR